MTSWTNKSSLLFLFFILTTFDLSEGGCLYYFTSNYFYESRLLNKAITIIETKNATNKLECSLEKKSLEDDEFRNILHNCFEEELSRKSGFSTTLPKCEGHPSRNVSFYQFMCMLAKSLNISDVEVCNYYDETCSLFNEFPHIIQGSTTKAPTTTTALPLNTTSVQPSAATNTTPANASDLACRFSNNGSTDDTVNSGWINACLFFMVLCAILLALCLWLCYQKRRDAQLLRTMTERASNAEMQAELEVITSRPHATGVEPEATSLMQTEASFRDHPAGNGSLH